MFLNFLLQLWVRSASDDSHAQEGTERIIQTDSRTKTIHWITNCFDQAFEQNSKEWLQRMNHSRMGIAHCPENSRRRAWNKLKHF